MLYKALQGGWVPPDSLSEAEYHAIKAIKDMDDPLTAFAGFGCSFGGKWFGGYQRSGDRNYALNAKRSLLKQIDRCKSVIFRVADYRDTIAESPTDSVIYLDPPYLGCGDYKAVAPFDTSIFWTIIRQFSATREIYVSEYVAPPDFECVWSLSVRSCITRDKWTDRTEKIFAWKGKTHDGVRTSV